MSAGFFSLSTYPPVKSFFAQECLILFQTIVFHPSKFSERVVSSPDFLLAYISRAHYFCLYRSLISACFDSVHFVGAAEPSPLTPSPHPPLTA
jgi:hypothetical protein